MLIFYYIINHAISCFLISFAAHKDDVRTTWLRRVPVPQDEGFRENPKLDDVSDASVYVHALFFTVNTVSHVAIGDLTSVNVSERALNSFIILCGTFIYAFLFGNVASIVADLAPQLYFNFHKRYQTVMELVKKEKLPPETRQRIKDYFDYVWAHSKGIDEEEILSGLPESLRSDIYLVRYSEVFHNAVNF